VVLDRYSFLCSVWGTGDTECAIHSCYHWRLCWLAGVSLPAADKKNNTRIAKWSFQNLDREEQEVLSTHVRGCLCVVIETLQKKGDCCGVCTHRKRRKSKREPLHKRFVFHYFAWKGAWTFFILLFGWEPRVVCRWHSLVHATLYLVWLLGKKQHKKRGPALVAYFVVGGCRCGTEKVHTSYYTW